MSKKSKLQPETAAIKAPKFEMWPIEKIVPYEKNSKKHDPDQVSKIALSIQKFGFDQPIVVDKDGVIIKGHGRRLACLQLGLKHVPVLVREDLTLEQANAARIADNKVAIGDFDTELLKLELQDLDIDDLRGIFDDKELDFLNADLTTMDTSMFVDDLEEAVSSQESETADKMASAEIKRIPVSKALGFKDVAGADQLVINRFMAKAETATGKTGDVAFVAYLNQLAA